MSGFGSSNGQEPQTKAAELMQEEEALGRWPRRLLHVPTLTSYEWQPGNNYGDYVEPKYNAITYTWGRWKLPDQNSSAVEALPVKGVPWKVPKIDPEWFTIAQLKSTIEEAAQIPSWNTDGSRNASPVEFVWIDIACIDQDRSNPRTASEIGRQLAIFQNAENVYAWINSLGNSLMAEVFRQNLMLEEFRDVDCMSNMWLFNKYSEVALQILNIILSDQWFTSVWTLQEAFIRPDAIFLSKESQVVKHPENLQSCYRLLTLLNMARFLRLWKSRSQNSSQMCKEVIKVVEDSGLGAISTRNPVAAFIAASRRNSQTDIDRIHGIQQIFQFRLGDTALENTPGTCWTPSELLRQLYTGMLLRYPIRSQMHVFTDIPTHGTRWHINPTSREIDLHDVHLGSYTEAEISNDTYMMEETNADCKFMVQPVDGQDVAFFEGHVSILDKFWHRTRHEQNESGGKGMPTFQTSPTFFLDACSELTSHPEYLGTSEDNCSKSRQNDIGAWLAQTFSNSLAVLALGRFKSHSTEFRVTGGILLHIEGIDGDWAFARRLGFCSWIEWANYQTADSFPFDWIKIKGVLL